MNTPESNKPQDQAADPAAIKRGKNTTRKALIGLGAAIFVATGAALVTYYASEADAWVGTVNGRKIPRDDYNRDLEMRKKQYQQRLGVDLDSPSGKDMVNNLRKDVIQQLVEREVLLAEAEKRKLTASPEEIDTRIKGIKTNFPDDAAFKKALADNGIDMESLKQHVGQSVVIEKLRDELTKGATVSVQQAKEAYDKNHNEFLVQEEVKASHILVKTKKEADDLMAKIKGGADFAELAKQHSEDTGSKQQGGDLGFFPKGRMVPEFEKAAFSLKPGKVSDPVQSQFGFHIIKVFEKREPRQKGFDEVKGEFMDQMLRSKKDKDFGDWIRAQRESAKVVIRPQYEAAPPAPPATGSGPVAVPANPPAPPGAGAAPEPAHP